MEKYFKKISYNSPVILTFVFISFFALVLNYITGGVTNRLFFSVYRSSMLSPLFYVRLFGHVLGHASWDHFTGNILLILVIGPMIEEKYGSKRLLIMILFTAFITGVFNVVFFNTGLLGASGIVFMLILLSSITKMTEQKIPLTLILVGIAYIGSEIVQGAISSDNISHITHIIGGFCGGIFGFISNKK